MPVPSDSPAVEIRAFTRTDRDQLADLVNIHAAAVIPNQSISVSALMSRLEHEPGEPIVDPWVIGDVPWWRSSVSVWWPRRTWSATRLTSTHRSDCVTPPGSVGWCSGRRRPTGRTVTMQPAS